MNLIFNGIKVETYDNNTDNLRKTTNNVRVLMNSFKSGHLFGYYHPNVMEVERIVKLIK